MHLTAPGMKERVCRVAAKAADVIFIIFIIFHHFHQLFIKNVKKSTKFTHFWEKNKKKRGKNGNISILSNLRCFPKIRTMRSRGPTSSPTATSSKFFNLIFCSILSKNRKIIKKDLFSAALYQKTGKLLKKLINTSSFSTSIF